MAIAEETATDGGAQEAREAEVGFLLQLPAQRPTPGRDFLLAAKPLDPRQMALDMDATNILLRHSHASNMAASQGQRQWPVVEAAPVAAKPNRGGSQREKKKRRGPPPPRVEIGRGWHGLLSEISTSDRRVRVARGGALHGPAGGCQKEIDLGSSVGNGEWAQTARNSSTRSPRNSPLNVLLSPLAQYIPGAQTVCFMQPCDIGLEATREAISDVLLEETTLVSHIGSQSGMVHREGEGVACDTADAEEDDSKETAGSPGAMAESGTWQSYRVDAVKVTDKDIEAMWLKASDPRVPHEARPLERVPRLNFTSREAEQLPLVYGIQHWRQANIKKKQLWMARIEAETYPSLDLMLRNIYGALKPPQLKQDTLNNMPKCDAHGFIDGELIDVENDEVVRHLAQQELILECFPDVETRGIGARERGRRGAIDEGSPWLRGGVGLLQEEGESGRTKQVTSLQSKKSLALVEAARGVMEDGHEDGLEKLEAVLAETRRVQVKCARRVKGVTCAFRQKQCQLSERLLRRMKRLQMDHEEIQDVEMASILPCIVDSNTSKGGVLGFLRTHRCKTERLRKAQQAVYLQQVEQFQLYLRLMADPNRHPEHGETFLSECFKHVLSAGFIVDETYFFRCLALLGRKELEVVFIVNCLAACVKAFTIDLKCYWSFLHAHGLPTLRPRARPDLVRAWEDWAPWIGCDLEPVKLRFLRQSSSQGERSSRNADVDVAGGDDALLVPSFDPVLPEEESVDVAEDPLLRVLETVAMDGVLTRYFKNRPEYRLDGQHVFSGNSMLGEDHDELLVHSASAAEGAVAAAHPTAPAPPSVPLGPGRRRPNAPRKLGGMVRMLAQAANEASQGVQLPAAQQHAMGFLGAAQLTQPQKALA